MKPNFLVIGAPKAATTSLCHLLGRHPEVFMCRPREPFYFCWDDVYARGWAWYESLFDGAAGFRAIGEGSTPYSQVGTHPRTVERISERLPEARIIYIVRHPMDRLESMWMEQSSQGRTMLPFTEALRCDPQYLDSALYWRQLSAYRERFPDERIRVLFFDDFTADPGAVLSECFEFLGVEPAVTIPGAAEPRYVSAGKRSDRPLTNVLRRKLPGFEGLRRAAPPWMRRAAAAALKRPIGGRPRWDPGTRDWLIGEIGADLDAFLRHCGRPADLWLL